MTPASFLQRVYSGLRLLLPGSTTEAQIKAADTLYEGGNQSHQVLLEILFYGIINHHIRSYDYNENRIIEALLRNVSNSEALLVDLRKSNNHSSEALLDALFSAAIRSENIEAVELLLRTRAADPLKRVYFPEYEDDFDYCDLLPIQAALRQGCVGVAECLCEYGAIVPKTADDIIDCGWRESPVCTIVPERIDSFLSLDYGDIFDLLQVDNSPELLKFLASKYTETWSEYLGLFIERTDIDGRDILHALLRAMPSDERLEITLASFLVSKYKFTGNVLADVTSKALSLAILSKLDAAESAEEDFDIFTDVDFVAIDGKTWNIITQMLEQGASLKHTAHGGNSALNLAVRLGLSHVVEGLLSLDAEAKTELNLTAEFATDLIMTPLLMAFYTRNTPLARLLIDAGAEVDGQCVYLALGLGMEVNLKRCTSFDKNSSQLLTPAAASFLYGSPMFPYQNLMDPDGYDASLLMVAVHSLAKDGCDRSLVQSMLRHRSDVPNRRNKHEGTALAFAACAGDDKLLNLLFSSGIGCDVASTCFDLKLSQPFMYFDFILQYSEMSKPWNTLGYVVQKGSRNMVKTLLDNGFLPSRETIKAAFKSETDTTVLDVLIHHLICNISLQSSNRDCMEYALYLASAGHNRELVQRILLSNVGVNEEFHYYKSEYETALGRAVANGNTKIARLLLEKGADVNHSSVVEFARGTATLELLRCYGAASSPFELLAAVQNGDTQLVRQILHSIGNVNAVIPGQDSDTAVTAFSKAVQNGNIEIARLLLEKGANANHPSVFKSARSTAVLQQLFDYPSVLLAAVEHGSVHLVELLISNGADINSRGAQTTPLQMAAMMGFQQIAKLLLDKEADCNSPGIGHSGRTALEGAAENGRLDMVSLLLESRTLTEGTGQRQYLRAVKFATRHCHHAVARLLRDHRPWTDDDERLFNTKDLLKYEGLCNIRDNYSKYGYHTDDRSFSSSDGADNVGSLEGTDDHSNTGTEDAYDTEMDMGQTEGPSSELQHRELSDASRTDEGQHALPDSDLPMGSSLENSVNFNDGESYWEVLVELGFQSPTTIGGQINFDHYDENSGPTLERLIIPDEL